jgi:hypothetical protein
MERAAVCAVSQPTFLPWLGWFDLADQVDLFVILDDVAFSKQSWQQRNRIRTARGLEFVSVPVKTAGRMGQKISDCELVDSSFVTKMLKSLQTNYARAPFFAEAIAELTELLHAAAMGNRLVELNCGLIVWIAGRLGVSTPMVHASSLNVPGQRGEHVAAICESVGAANYVSPLGAENYLMDDRQAFSKRNIAVWMQMYDHPQYAQVFSPFMAHACALDLIFNLGPSAGEVMRSGRRLTRALGENGNSQSE